MIAGILLAAGRSSRMGGRDKLLLPLGGEPMVRRAAKTLAEGDLSPLVVVVPPGSVELREVLGDLPIRLVECPRCGEGLSASLAAGVGALGEDCDAAAIALGDMPLLLPRTIRELARAFRQGGHSLAAPTFEGRRGHPVLFDLAAHRTHLLALRGDAGARPILEANADDVRLVPVEDEGVLLDADTWEAYEQMRRRF